MNFQIAVIDREDQFHPPVVEMFIEELTDFVSRCLENVNSGGLADALAKYEAARKPRTSKVQTNSLANDWLKGQENVDWVYGYSAWDVDLE